ncbi:MAG: 2-phospho-L-lactate guanylyltransferase [Chloroflexota bacterium]
MIVAAVPLKRLTAAKSRLSTVLPPGERSDLVMSLLRRTLSIVKESGVVDRIVLVTEERALGEEFGVETMNDLGGLNVSLRAAAEWAQREGASSILIAPGDLPFLLPDDIQHVIDARVPGPSVVLSQTRDGGTGVLLLSPPAVIAPAFGPRSADEHARLARACGVPLVRVASEGLSFDLDTRADLEKFMASTAT